MYERAIEKVGGVFRATILIQRRVREIVRGASPLIPVTPEMTPADIALREILEGKVWYEGAGEDAKSSGDGKAKKAKPEEK